MRKRQIILLLFVSLAMSASTHAQRSKRFDPDGAFWIIGTAPNEFSDFGGINLNSKKLRRLPASGVDSTKGRHYRFKTVTIQPNNFTFTTVSLGGVSYSFTGKFLKGGVFAEAMLDDTIPVLEGILTKYKNGLKVAEANLKFSYFGGT